MLKNSLPEILAPAGSFEAVVAAVNSGADAVYLGQKSFSARASAANFDADELARAVSLCHIHGAKVYQAVNTVVFDAELPALRDCIQTACAAGVDAFIVQDFGVARLLREWAPEIPLHASTQMSITSLSGVLQAHRMGLKRAVLARELSLEEIRAIAEVSPIELEVFVHGALCMCVSGQCTLSAMIGSRSANRGGCAQPCRLPFSVNGSGSADLSLKDLCALEMLPALVACGVASFKIEGRMKRPEYVGAAVRAVYEKLHSGAPDVGTLRSVFSRGGFTNGYLENKRGREMFGVRTKEDVAAAQGVLGRLAAENRTVLARVPLQMELTLRAGEPAALAAADPEGHTVTVTGSVPEAALTRPLDEERARALLAKLGGTPYFLTSLEFISDSGLMLPASAVNALRRNVVEKLDVLRGVANPKRFSGELPVFSGRHPGGGGRLRPRFCSIRQMEGFPLEAMDFYLPLSEVCAHFKDLAPYRARLIAELPRVRFSEEALISQLAALKAAGFQRVCAQNIGHLLLAKQEGFEIHGGFSLNITNSVAAEELAASGAVDLTVSFESKLAQFDRLHSPIPAGLVIYGSLPLMVFRNCPVKAQRGCKGCRRDRTLTDRLGNRFPVRCDGEVAELFNHLPLNLSDKPELLSRADFGALYFTGESPEECARILADYQNGNPPRGSFTRGLYFRGIE